VTDLPDVNVWLALADENHLHHPRARVYWQRESASSIAFCRATILVIGYWLLVVGYRLSVIGY